MSEKFHIYWATVSWRD